MTALVQDQPATIEIDPFCDELLSNPYSYHEALREAGPVLWFPKYGVYGVARHDLVRDVLKDWQTFTSQRGVGLVDYAKAKAWRKPSLLLECDPPLHKKSRGVMNRVVSLPRLKKLAESWHEIAAELVASVTDQRRFDAVVDLAEQFPLRIFPDTLGLPEDGRENLLRYAMFVFNSFGPENEIRTQSMVGLGPALDWIAEACRYENLALGKWGRDVHDFAAAEGFSVEERELLVRSFLSAGVDTTINGIGNLLHAFAQNPQEWDKLRADRSLLKRAIEEGFRWDSTAQLFFRTTTCATDIDGVRIPEGSKIIAFYAAANRDPRRWEEPDRFDITRNSSGHLAFGFGVHQCLGQMIARLEAEAVITALLDRVRTIRPAGPPVRRLNNTLHALASLPVEVEMD